MGHCSRYHQLGPLMHCSSDCQGCDSPILILSAYAMQVSVAASACHLSHLGPVCARAISPVPRSKRPRQLACIPVVAGQRGGAGAAAGIEGAGGGNWAGQLAALQQGQNTSGSGGGAAGVEGACGSSGAGRVAAAAALQRPRNTSLCRPCSCTAAAAALQQECSTSRYPLCRQTGQGVAAALQQRHSASFRCLCAAAD